MTRLGDSVAMLETMGDRYGKVVITFDLAKQEPWMVLVEGVSSQGPLVLGLSVFFDEAVQQAYDMSAALEGHERPGAGNAVQR